MAEKMKALQEQEEMDESMARFEDRVHSHA